MTQAPPARTVEMFAMYAAGATLEEVGDRFGVSRERVRQVFAEAGLATRSGTETAAARRERMLAEKGDLIRAGFAAGADVKELALQLAVPQIVVREALGEELLAADRRRMRVREPIFSRKELLEFLRDAISASADGLSRTGYREYAEARARIEGRHWPSPFTLCRRFGSWGQALREAGMDVDLSPRLHERKFSDADCSKAVELAAAVLGEIPTEKAYNEFARSAPKGRFPSAMTIRHRFGLWHRALEAAGLDLGVQVAP